VTGKKSLYESIVDTQEEIRHICKEADALTAELQCLKDNFWKLVSTAATEDLAKEAAKNPPGEEEPASGQESPPERQYGPLDARKDDGTWRHWDPKARQGRGAYVDEKPVNADVDGNIELDIF